MADDASTAAYDYALPDELIAQHPTSRRDESRLLVLDGASTFHRRFRDLPERLDPGDVLVLNETRVIAARLHGERLPGGGRVELLLLHPAQTLRYDARALRWTALARPARRLHAGQRISFGEFGEATVRREAEEGVCEIELHLQLPLERFLERAGRMPLPPYIHNDSAEAQERYQTVFARLPGSVAAPTASLHFTTDVLDRIAKRGVTIVRVCLNVGLGTFRPVSDERIDRHQMHAEAYAIGPEAAETLAVALREKRRIVAAGTTVVRALEGNVRAFGEIRAGEHATDIFITPGFDFRVVGALMTNFHLPRSTLLMLVSAFAGRERVLHAYGEAIAERYRFYSFGDAMFVSR
ncbi:MAG: tRNA preQ1(34) S-adenosylmethionine ribosyltransferase-isomerase QueA [Candidatus Baltobacteraceae bacterium]